MSNPYVRDIGTVECVFGSTVRVGVDYDSVTVNGVPLGPEVRDEFMKLFMQADTEAKAWAEVNAEPECLASHCPPSATVDCEYPKCAPGQASG